ncbi:hypothetical protein [Candidatus Nitrosotenuis uzonensis]|uniref:Uncharacterized protein n=1 Tax=Candidatus Nitrosotenuis uzonensis TaxID=1407055 RepID=V6ARK7_9ARCH|nr:hypothetical protein [Candidatus Nitrosotenuis uzonensis]CDI05155.1 hypothetical protein NITUZ_140230 [Candidatus Nitrosotenuis uzonensis]
MEKSKLEKKFTSMIDTFRQEYEKLSPEEKRYCGPAESLSKLCQIYIITCKDYELYLVIKTSFPDLPDKLVKVIEVTPKNFEKQLEDFSNQDIWKREIEGEFGKTRTYDFFLPQIVEFGRKMRQRSLELQSKLTGFWGNSLAFWDFAGSIDDIDLDAKAKFTIQVCKNSFTRLQAQTTNDDVQPSTFAPKTGWGAYFYPFILIGEFKKTFMGQLSGGDHLHLDDTVYDGKFDHIHLIVNRDGLVGLDTEEGTKANNVINTIFGTALLLGLNCYANRLHELATVFVKDRLFVHSWQIAGLRTVPYDYRSRYVKLDVLRRLSVPIEVLTEILQTAEKIWQGKFAGELRLLLESYTHAQNNELLQSFNTSWLVIEKYLRQKWDKKLQSDGMRKQLKNWDLGRILDVLKTDDDITADDFHKMDELRETRNIVFHGKDEIDVKKSIECFEAALTIIRNETEVSKKFDSSQFETIDV